MKVLLDTNIILDIVEKREPFFSNSFQIFMKSAKKEIEAIIGASSVTDIYFITRKNCKNAEQALSFIIDMLKVVTLVDTKATDIQEATKLNFSDFEDAVVTVTAAREGADYLVTRNAADFINSPVSVISPADFLKKFP
jgi:predicted nucleic acid-binding protein